MNFKQYWHSSYQLDICNKNCCRPWYCHCIVKRCKQSTILSNILINRSNLEVGLMKFCTKQSPLIIIICISKNWTIQTWSSINICAQQQMRLHKNKWSRKNKSFGPYHIRQIDKFNVFSGSCALNEQIIDL